MSPSLTFIRIKTMNQEQKKADRYLHKLQNHTGWWRATVAEMIEGPKGGLIRLEETGEVHPISQKQLKSLQDAFEGDVAGQEVDFQFGKASTPSAAPSLPGVGSGSSQPTELGQIVPADSSRSQEVEEIPEFNDVSTLMARAMMKKLGDHMGEGMTPPKPSTGPADPQQEQESPDGRGR